MGTDLLRKDGTTNTHFINRVAAAASVFAAGKVKNIVISGHSDNRGYNEVDGMAQALSELGVPASAMVRDYKGSRTWETAKQAKRHYGLGQVLIVTDGFHASRCVYLFKQEGIDAIAFITGDEQIDYWYFRHRLREYLARVRAVIDIAIGDRTRTASLSAD